MREQEKKSLEFWDSQASCVENGMTPGLMVSDVRLSDYRDQAEKLVFYKRMEGMLNTGFRVLEVGCGAGRWTVDFANRFSHVTAVDISSKILDHARERAAREGLRNVVFQAASFEEIEYGAESFDMVYLGSCLHYMSAEAINEALSRLDNSVTENTILISRDTVSLIGRTFHRSERYETQDPAIYRLPEEYETMLGKFGWRLTDSWPTYVRPLSWRLRFAIPSSLLVKIMGFEAKRAPFMVRHASFFDRPSDKQHRFFVYRKR